MELAIINGTYRDSQSKSSPSRKPTQHSTCILLHKLIHCHFSWSWRKLKIFSGGSRCRRSRRPSCVSSVHDDTTATTSAAEGCCSGGCGRGSCREYSSGWCPSNTFSTTGTTSTRTAWTTGNGRRPASSNFGRPLWKHGRSGGSAEWICHGHRRSPSSDRSWRYYRVAIRTIRSRRRCCRELC